MSFRRRPEPTIFLALYRKSEASWTVGWPRTCLDLLGTVDYTVNIAVINALAVRLLADPRWLKVSFVSALVHMPSRGGVGGSV